MIKTIKEILLILLLVGVSFFLALTITILGVFIIGTIVGIDVLPLLKYSNTTFKEKLLFYTGQIYGMFVIIILLFLKKRLRRK